MFITDDDYIQVSADVLKIIQQSDPKKRLKAENWALKEITSYVGGRYDMEAAFAMEGVERDEQLVGIAVDIALFRLYASIPGRMGIEERKDLYEKAITFLKEVQKGNATLDIPTVTGPNGEEDYNNPIRYGCGLRNRYDW